LTWNPYPINLENTAVGKVSECGNDLFNEMFAQNGLIGNLYIIKIKT